MDLKTDDLESMRLPELWALFAHLLGIENRTPNRKFLIRKIREATVGTPDEPEPDLDGDAGVPELLPVPPGDIREPVADAPDPADQRAATAQVDRGADLRRLPIADLQARFLEVVGRPSASTNAGFLAWKIREVQKGRIPAGPVRRPVADEPAKMKVLPLRLPGATVEAMDAAVERLGFASRMAFLRVALAGYLEGCGEPAAARLLAGGRDEA